MMEACMIKKYFSFQDIINAFPVIADTTYPSKPNDNDASSNWFTKVLADASINLKYAIEGLASTYTADTISAIVNALMNIVYNRHAEDFVYAVYINPQSYWEGVDYTLASADICRALSGLINVLNNTAPRYIPIFTKNKDYSSDPVAAISSHTEGVSNFNDTPQNIGDFGDEDHTTNISTSSSDSTVDSGSIMERLSAMFDNWKSVILEWSNEFNQLFIKEGQVL